MKQKGEAHSKTYEKTAKMLKTNKIVKVIIMLLILTILGQWYFDFSHAT
jgi:hypothetical protein